MSSRLEPVRGPTVTCSFDDDFICGYEIDSLDNVQWRQAKSRMKLNRSNSTFGDYGTSTVGSN
jgi:hypothetical protein